MSREGLPLLIRRPFCPSLLLRCPLKTQECGCTRCQFRLERQACRASVGGHRRRLKQERRTTEGLAPSGAGGQRELAK